MKRLVLIVAMLAIMIGCSGQALRPNFVRGVVSRVRTQSYSQYHNGMYIGRRYETTVYFEDGRHRAFAGVFSQPVYVGDIYTISYVGDKATEIKHEKTNL